MNAQDIRDADHERDIVLPVNPRGGEIEESEVLRSEPSSIPAHKPQQLVDCDPYNLRSRFVETQVPKHPQTDHYAPRNSTTILPVIRATCAAGRFRQCPVRDPARTKVELLDVVRFPSRAAAPRRPPETAAPPPARPRAIVLSFVAAGLR